MKKPINVSRTVKYTTEAHDRTMRILAVIAVLMGAFLTFVVVRTSRSGDVRYFGIPIMLWGAGHLVYSALARPNPKPRLELSQRGLVYRVIPNQDIVIDWNDISAIETLDEGRTRSGDRIYSTIIVVPARVFDASVKAPPAGIRGLFWARSIRREVGNVRLRLGHAPLSLSFEDLRGEIDARWRAFSDHPNAKNAPEPWISETQRKPLPRGLKLAIAATAIAVAIPVIYYFHLINRWMLTNEPNDDMKKHYFEELVTRGGVTARKVGGGMIRVGSLQIADARYTQCKTEIFRLYLPNAWLPRYDSVSYCNTDLRLRSGEGAIAIWKIYTKTDSYRDSNDKEASMRYRAAGTFDPGEGEARLCEMGRC